MSTAGNNHAAVGGGRHPVDTGPPGRLFLLANAGWILLVALFVVAGAAALSWSRTPVYTATAQVQVRPQVVAGTNVAQPVDMGTEKAVATSTAVVRIAARHLHEPMRAIASGLSVAVPVDTGVLDIKHTDRSPAVAQRRAQAVAEAYVSYSANRQRADLAAVKKANRANLPVVPAPPPALINDAGLPTSPASPKHLVDLAIAVVIGLALGVGVALLKDRRDDRVRGGADLAAQSGAPLLGQIPAYRPHGVVDASPVADAYRQVRARLSRSLAPERAGTLLVVPASAHPTGATAANLAAGLARTGTRVVLLGSAETFGVPPQPSLGAVLAGAASVAGAVRPTPVTGLTVLPTGGYGDPDALLDRTALTQVMRELCWRADLVVVDAPPVPAGPDAELLAAHADLALIVARARRTHRRAVRQAAERLAAAGATVAGCVLDGAGRRRRVAMAHWSPAAAGRSAVRGRLSALAGRYRRLFRRRAAAATAERPNTTLEPSTSDGHRPVAAGRRTPVERPPVAAPAVGVARLAEVARRGGGTGRADTGQDGS